MSKYLCEKCLRKINIANIIIKNSKLVCPYCSHTLETDRFKVQQVMEMQDSKKEETSNEDKSTDK